MSAKEWIIAGLGNPGAKYEETRHNIGFMALDELARRHQAVIGGEKWQAYSTRLRLWGQNVSLVKPQTFMNLSGRSVARFADFFKVPPEQIVVIHDDLDLAPGRLKLTCGGGAGGHNGIRSMIECLGTPAFYRLKWGIGKPGQGEVDSRIDVQSYVLSRFTVDELHNFVDRIDVVEQGLKHLLADDRGRAMTLINSVK
ncbi:MAG: aminoacyl-tRNA hydrolase [Desulfobulbaceae bacterium]|uniref:Peptidyl-tRNA hydrolase n=1 Tax=Candidatus Desulfatifera sulfidica TaxID=2841691 RepID=A0A8J6NAN7_9BACT|nr:aminoacyl-tRNA hydrolase [Candidatus Desulfatifera sulfidica]